MGQNLIGVILKTAIFIDLDFFLRKLNYKFPFIKNFSPEEKANFVSNLIYKYINCHLNYKKENNILYRTYVYDCPPENFNIHNPLSNKLVNYSESFMSIFRKKLHDNIKKLPSTALRLGKLDINNRKWIFRDYKLFKKLIREMGKIKYIEYFLQENTEDKISREIVETIKRLCNFKKNEELSKHELKELKNVALNSLRKIISELEENEFILDINQKQVDMKIGMDITHIALKGFVEKIILISGDSDFVPVAKLARTEGVIFILDPMSHNISIDLSEHIDGIRSPLINIKCIKKLSLDKYIEIES